jgi:hypothetical protein
LGFQQQAVGLMKAQVVLYEKMDRNPFFSGFINDHISGD